MSPKHIPIAMVLGVSLALIGSYATAAGFVVTSPDSHPGLQGQFYGPNQSVRSVGAINRPFDVTSRDSGTGLEGVHRSSSGFARVTTRRCCGIWRKWPRLGAHADEMIVRQYEYALSRSSLGPSGRTPWVGVTPSARFRKIHGRGVSGIRSQFWMYLFRQA